MSSILKSDYFCSTEFMTAICCKRANMRIEYSRKTSVSKLLSSNHHSGLVLLCLFSIILHIALPITHIIHGHETGSIRPGFQSGRVHVFTSPNYPGENPSGHHHDPSSCPLCQAISQAYGNSAIGASNGITIVSDPGQRISPDFVPSRNPAFHNFNRSPRSPPFFA